MCGFQNNGAKLYNVTSVWGSLNSPFNSKMFIQNVRDHFLRGVVRVGCAWSLHRVLLL